MDQKHEHGNKPIARISRTAISATLSLAVFMAAMPIAFAQSEYTIHESASVVNKIVSSNGGEEAGVDADHIIADESGGIKLYYMLGSDRKTLVPGARNNPMTIQGVNPGATQIPLKYVPEAIGEYKLAETQNLTVNVVSGKTVTAYVLYEDIIDRIAHDDVEDFGADSDAETYADGGGSESADENANTDTSAGDRDVDPREENIVYASYTIRYMMEDGTTPAPITPNPLTVEGVEPGNVTVPADYRPYEIADGLYVLQNSSDTTVNVTEDNSAEIIYTYKAARGYGYRVVPSDEFGTPLAYDGFGDVVDAYETSNSQPGETKVYFPHVEGFRKVEDQPETVELTVYNNIENPAVINAIYEYDPYWRGGGYDLDFRLYGEDTVLRNYPGGASISVSGKRLGLQGVKEYMTTFIDDETGDVYRIAPLQDLTVNLIPGERVVKDIYYMVDNTRNSDNYYTITLNYVLKNHNEFLPDYSPNPHEIWGLENKERVNLAEYFPTEFGNYRILELPESDITIDERDLDVYIEYEYREPSVPAGYYHSVFFNYSFGGEDTVIEVAENTNAKKADADNTAAGVTTAENTAAVESGADNTAAGASADEKAAAGNAAAGKQDTAGAGQTGVSQAGAGQTGVSQAGAENGALNGEFHGETAYKVYYYLNDGINVLPGSDEDGLDYMTNDVGVVDLSADDHNQLAAEGFALSEGQNMSVYVDADGASAIALFYEPTVTMMGAEDLEQTESESFIIDDIILDLENSNRKGFIVTGKGLAKATVTIEWEDGTTSGTKVHADGEWAMAIPLDIAMSLYDGYPITGNQTEKGKLPSKKMDMNINRRSTRGRRPEDEHNEHDDIVEDSNGDDYGG